MMLAVIMPNDNDVRRTFLEAVRDRFGVDVVAVPANCRFEMIAADTGNTPKGVEPTVVEYDRIIVAGREMPPRLEGDWVVRQPTESGRSPTR